MHIFAPVPKFTGFQVAFRKCCQRSGLRKCVKALASGVGPLISAPRCEQLHGVSDRRDIPVLRDDKCDQHLPGVLPQDANAFLLFRGLPQKEILVAIDPAAYFLIVLPQVKIFPPEVLKLVVRAFKLISVIAQRCQV